MAQIRSEKEVKLTASTPPPMIGTRASIVVPKPPNKATLATATAAIDNTPVAMKPL